jgi:hypothetical protein
MKYTFKRYWIWIVLLIACIVILVLLVRSNRIEVNIFLVITATLLTIFISIINFHQNGDKFFKELFTEFNNRYDILNDKLIAIATDKKLEGEEKQKVIDYINLCAEEYMWVRKGRIPVHIWNSWKNGIEGYLRNEAIKEVFDEEKALWKSSYYGFFDELDK